MEEYDDIKSFLEASILTLGSPFVPSDEVVQSLKNIPSPTVAVVAQRMNELLLAEMKKTFSKSKQQDLLKQIQAIHNKQLLKGIAQQNTIQFEDLPTKWKSNVDMESLDENSSESLNHQIGHFNSLQREIKELKIQLERAQNKRQKVQRLSQTINKIDLESLKKTTSSSSEIDSLAIETNELVSEIYELLASKQTPSQKSQSSSSSSQTLKSTTTITTTATPTSSKNSNSTKSTTNTKSTRKRKADTLPESLIEQTDSPIIENTNTTNTNTTNTNTNNDTNPTVIASSIVMTPSDSVDALKKFFQKRKQ